MKDLFLRLLKMFNLTPEDVMKVFKGLIIALVSAALTYLTQWISGHNFGPWTPMIMMVWSVVVNTIRKSIDTPVQKMTGVQI